MKSILSTILVLAFTSVLMSQEDWQRSDFGRFCLSIGWSKDVTLLLYRIPSKTAKPFARYRVFDLVTGPNSGIAGVSTITYTDTNRESPGSAVFDLEHGATFGIAGLAYSPDSQWVSISLGRDKPTDSTIAWVNLRQAQEAGISIQEWSTFLLSKSSLYFRSDSAIQFYSTPSLQDRLNLTLTKREGSDQYDYSLEPTQVRGEWMQARLYIPSRFLQDEETAKKRDPPLTVWIKYLNQAGRPQLWYMWE